MFIASNIARAGQDEEQGDIVFRHGQPFDPQQLLLEMDPVRNLSCQWDRPRADDFVRTFATHDFPDIRDPRFFANHPLRSRTPYGFQTPPNQRLQAITDRYCVLGTIGLWYSLQIRHVDGGSGHGSGGTYGALVDCNNKTSGHGSWGAGTL